ncbi:MAG: hypothetical protein QNJ38_23840 [Prochloraceae cyanobacterium]|nr:hypothetical protein [Prochloraceae cyanobacterium]
MLHTTLANTNARSRHRSHNFSFSPDSASNSIDVFYNALLAVLPKAEQILRYNRNVGRGRVFWAYYATSEGKKFATFISPKEFKGYKWCDGFSKVVNLENGSTYQVTNSYCSCPDWNNRVRTGKKKQCKHQAMRAEHIGINLSDSLPKIAKVEQVERLQPQNTPPKVAKIEQVERVQPQRRRSKLYEVNPNILDDGFTLEKIQDSTNTKYYLKAWYKSDPLVATVFKTLGIITETERGFVVTGADEKSQATVPFQADCVGWLLRYNGISYHKEILPAYQEIEAKQCPDCGTIDSTAAKQINYCTLCGWSRTNTPAFRH